MKILVLLSLLLILGLPVRANPEEKQALLNKLQAGWEEGVNVASVTCGGPSGYNVTNEEVADIAHIYRNIEFTVTVTSYKDSLELEIVR